MPSAQRKFAIAAGLAATGALAGGVALTGGGDGDRSDQVTRAVDDGRARNVIILVGDGMDEQQITAARNYERGAAGRFGGLDAFTLTGDKTTYSVREDDPAKPDYSPESASTATAFSTGSKTSDGRISTAPGTDRDLPTNLELAQRRGLRTGNVSTAEITDATPAAPMSHVRLRACQGPRDMATCPQDRKSAGGPGSIAEQSVDKGVDVLLGGGRNRYEQTIDGGPDAGRTVIESARAKGYRYVTDEAGLASARPGQKLLGLFTPGNQTTEWTGAIAARPPSGPQRCDESNRDQARTSEPSLAQSATKAIDLLSAGENGGRGRSPGFFLQVEGASIDKRAHAGDPCGHIGETVAFDRAVQAALQFARKDGKTLVVVTGDHAHAPQIVEDDATPAGSASRLTTDEGEIETLSYGTGQAPSSQEHTGAQIRIAAYGPQAANVTGLIDDTEQFDLVARAIGGEGGSR